MGGRGAGAGPVIPVPPVWLDHANSTHAPRWQVEVERWEGATLVETVQAVGVSFTVSRSSQSWPRLSVTVRVPATGTPAPAPRWLMPWGALVRVTYQLPGGDPVVVAVAHVIRSRLDRPEGVWTLEAADTSGLIGADAITARRPAPVSGTVAAAITALIRRTIPTATVTVSGPAASSPVPADWEVGRDPWAACVALADLAGSTIRIHPDDPDAFTVAPEAALGTPVDELAVGVNVNGYPVTMERTWNAVAVEYTPTGGSGVAVTGWWVDDRPDSPLRPSVLGTHLTLVKQAVGLPTQAQADAAAAVWARREAGWVRSTEWRIIPRPWLEPDDTINAVFSGGPVESQLVTATDLSHGPGRSEMTVRTRNSRYVSDLEV